MKKYHIVSTDKHPLCVHVFDTLNPKAIIQVIHGMEEHQGRYEAFAKYLCQKGFTVVTSDLRGHGQEAKDPGHFKEKHGASQLVKDQICIRRFIKRQYPDTPVYLFAHSMGTIITRVLLQSRSLDYDKVVLSGFPNYQAAAHLALPISKGIAFLKGAKYKSSFLQKLSVGRFNKAIDSPKTDDDWVCSDEAVVCSYQKDPLCGIGFTCTAFHDLYELVIRMHRVNLYHNVKEDLRILCLYGSNDPCVGGQKGKNDSLRILYKAGFTDIRQKEYPDMRHEILNEIDKDIVWSDVATFFLE